MAAISAITQQQLLQRLRSVVKASTSIAVDLFGNNPECLRHRINVMRAIAPVDAQPWHAHVVRRSSKFDPAIRVRLLFGMEVERELSQGRPDNDGRELTVGEKAFAHQVKQELRRTNGVSCNVADVRYPV